jgi:hypothetical protein
VEFFRPTGEEHSKLGSADTGAVEFFRPTGEEHSKLGSAEQGYSTP